MHSIYPLQSPHLKLVEAAEVQVVVDLVEEPADLEVGVLQVEWAGTVAQDMEVRRLLWLLELDISMDGVDIKHVDITMIIQVMVRIENIFASKYPVVTYIITM